MEVAFADDTVDRGVESGGRFGTGFARDDSASGFCNASALIAASCEGVRIGWNGRVPIMPNALFMCRALAVSEGCEPVVGLGKVNSFGVFFAPFLSPLSLCVPLRAEERSRRLI